MVEYQGRCDASQRVRVDTRSCGPVEQQGEWSCDERVRVAPWYGLAVVEHGGSDDDEPVLVKGMLARVAQQRDVMVR